MFPKRLITLFLSFSLLLLVKSGYTQIIITASDLGNYYKIGNVITQKFDTLAESVMIDIGMPGGGNTWDFRSVPFSETSQLQMVLDPATTPGTSAFSNANRSIFFEIKDEDGNSDAYNYFSLTNDGVDFLGTYGITEADGETLITQITYNPVQQTSPLPLKFNDTWSYQGKESIKVILDGMSNPFGENDVNNTYEVDAYGTLLLPDGTNEAALRVKQVLVTKIELFPGFPLIDSTLNFLFLTQTGAIASVEAESINEPSQGMIQGNLNWSSSSAVSSTSNLEAKGFKLLEVAPNPVKQNTMIDYTVPEATSIRLNLFDQNGRLVKMLFNGRQEVGPNRVELNIEDLASGQYYLSLLAQNSVLTRKVIVQK